MQEKGKDGSRKGKNASSISLSISLVNSPSTSIEPSRHTPDALIPATLQIARLVEIRIVHVALEVRLRAAVVAEKALDVQELASRVLRADVLAGFVGLAVFGDVVGEGFGGAGVHVGAAGFGAPDGSVGGRREGDGRGFGDGGGCGDWDDDEGGRDGDGNCGAVDVLGCGGRGETGEGGGGCCDEARYVDC